VAGGGATAFVDPAVCLDGVCPASRQSWGSLQIPCLVQFAVVRSGEDPGALGERSARPAAMPAI
jgi:hypothetical protein